MSTATPTTAPSGPSACAASSEQPLRDLPGCLALPCPAEDVDGFLSEPTPGVVQLVDRTPGSFLVLGAGGKMGLHLALMLRRALDQLGRSDRVVAVSRFASLHRREEFHSHGVATLACDLTDPAELAVLPDAPTVFFLAGMKFGTADAPELLTRFNVTMPALVAERFGRSRIVAFSTGCVYPFVKYDSGGATEATAPDPVGEYARSCLGREEAFVDASRRHGTRVALVRLNYSVEFRYGLLVDVAQTILRGEPVDVSTGQVNAIWQRDAVAHAIQALTVADSPPVPLNVTGAETLSVRALALRLGELLQRPVQFVGTEATTAWLNNASRAHALFGRPTVAVEEMLAWTAAWLGRDGQTWGKPTAFARRDGRF